MGEFNKLPTNIESKKTSVSVEEPSLPTPISFLSIDAKADLLTKLKSWGIDGSNLNDLELINKVAAYADESHNKFISKEADSLEKKLNFYAMHNPMLTDKDFIARLYYMNVLPMWLSVFTDADGVKLPESQWRKDAQGNVFSDGKWMKDDKRIWNRIRRRGKRQFDKNENATIFKARYRLPDLSQTNRLNENDD